MQTPRQGPSGRTPNGQLVRSSFVPLYYQLQELLKEQIESGVWRPGDLMPSEPDLAHEYGVSRVVVRQALAILEDDHQIVRVRGRGTFVTEPKIEMRAGGLTRLLAGDRDPHATLLVLDNRLTRAERSVRSWLDAAPDEELLRITTLLSLDDKPLAITYSFFRQPDAEWLEYAAEVGAVLPADLTPAHHGVRLTTSQLTIETSHCGQFEADRFGIPYRSGVFLMHSVEHMATPEGSRPLEFARAEYRGDAVQFRLSCNAETSWFSSGNASST